MEARKRANLALSNLKLTQQLAASWAEVKTLTSYTVVTRALLKQKEDRIHALETLVASSSPNTILDELFVHKAGANSGT